MKRFAVSWLVGSCCVATAISPVSLQAQEPVSVLYLFKAAWYEQKSAADPVLYPQSDDPYDFTALAYVSDELLSDPDWELWVNGMTLRTPNGRTEPLNLNPDAGSFDFYEGAVTDSALSIRFGAGSYRLTFSSVLTGESRYDVPLAADDYPPAPKVLNFDAAQTVDPGKEFKVRWTPFTGGGEREIWMQVVDADTYEIAFEGGPFAGSQEEGVIPGGTLQPNTAYLVQLSFTRYTHLSAGTVPESYSGFEAYNTVPLTTKDGGSAPDPSMIRGWRVLTNGDLELTVACTTNRPLTLQGVADLGSTWSNLQTATHAASPATLVVPKAALGGLQFLRTYQE